jgi:hypothetical protein
MAINHSTLVKYRGRVAALGCELLADESDDGEGKFFVLDCGPPRKLILLDADEVDLETWIVDQETERADQEAADKVIPTRDLIERALDAIRYARSTCDVLVADPDLQEIHTETVAGVSLHLHTAKERLEEWQGRPSENGASTHHLDDAAGDGSNGAQATENFGNHVGGDFADYHDEPDANEQAQREQNNDLLGSLYAIVGQAKILREDAIDEREYALSIAHVIIAEGERAIKALDRPASERESAQ